MIITASEVEARQTRHGKSGHSNRLRPDGTEAASWCVNYIGKIRHQIGPEESRPGPDTLYPQAYLNEQGAQVEVGAHFHTTADEFLLVVGGQATLGRLALKPVTIYFAAAYTAYGPIKAGPSGLRYFTLRNRWDTGSRFMPGARAELRAARGRHREAAGSPVDPASAGPRMEEENRVSLIPSEADGLGAWLYRLPPGGELVGPEPNGGGGQYWIVTAGSLDHGGELLAPFSCIFLSADERGFSVKAGPAGVQLVAAQFPR